MFNLFYLIVLYRIGLDSVITPVVKSNKYSIRDVNNCRPIALAITFSKLFELIMLHYLHF